ncbi:MAG: hypothetical protein ACKOEC_07265 [Acidimicrobiia bacterium]
MSFPTSRVEAIELGLSVANFLLLVAIAFRLKRDVALRMNYLQETVGRIVGRNPPTPYDERKVHFSEEKNRLVEELVRHELPTRVNELIETHNNKDMPVAIIVDSGTTLEGLFPRLKFLGLGPNVSDAATRNLEIYSNSLSGSDAFSKEPASVLAEHQLHLFGGIQIEKYRAVVGDVTLRAMQSVKEDLVHRRGNIIGLITANWCLVGSDHDELIICSSEKHHLEYKKYLAEVADVLIIVSPLGKLLKLKTVDHLNEILNRKALGLDRYEGFSLKRDRQSTFLMTTKRANRNSILFPHSERFWADRTQSGRSYRLLPATRNLKYDPPGAPMAQLDIEVPHEYLRIHRLEVLQISV